MGNRFVYKSVSSVFPKDIMKLDLRFNTQIDAISAKRLSTSANSERKSFHGFLENLSADIGGGLDWWMASPASRQTLSSPLFHYYSALAVLNEMLDKQEPLTEIHVSSQGFAEVVQALLVKHQRTDINLIKHFSFLSRVKNCLCRFLRVGFQLYRHWRLWRIGSKAAKRFPAIPQRPLTLIDTCVLPGFVEKDRYYPGLWEQLEQDEKENTFFAPSILGFSVKEMPAVFERLRKSEKNYLIKESFLTLSDYLFAFAHVWRLFRLKVPASLVQGVDFAPVVAEELYALDSLGASITGLLNFRFARRLKESSQPLRLVVDWFENQVVDKGWHAGFNRYLPEVEHVGAQGFLLFPLELNLLPAAYEAKYDLLPSQVGVIGQGYCETVREFHPELKAEVIPAFRFGEVYRERQYQPPSDSYAILVTLPILIAESAAILRALEEALSQEQDVRIYFKIHPIVDLARLKKAMGGVWPQKFELVDGDIHDCIERVHLVVGNSSSTCMEALSRGVPVIVMANMSGIVLNPVPDDVPEVCWKFCHTIEDALLAMQKFRKQKETAHEEYQQVAKEIRAKYFEPVTRESVCKFLRL